MFDVRELAITPKAIMVYENGEKEKGTWLDELDEEKTFLNNALNKSRLVDLCHMDGPDFPNIYLNFKRFNRRVSIFHFSGHAHGRGLKLKDIRGVTRTTFVESIADCACGYEGVKLVFLNGCSTREQVAFFQKKGDATVIATTKPVRDDVASHFSQAFYSLFMEGTTLEEAFEGAEKAILSMYENPQYYYRDIIEWNDGKKGRNRGESDAHPYKIIPKRKEDLQGTLQQWQKELEEEYDQAVKLSEEEKTSLETQEDPAEKKTIPPAELAYLTCNRNPESNTFCTWLKSQYTQGTKEAKAFIIHGSETESPLSLAERFYEYDIEASLKKLNIRNAHKNLLKRIDFPDRDFLVGDHKKEKELEEKVFEQSFDSLMSQFAYQLGREPEEVTADLVAEKAIGKKLFCIVHDIPSEEWNANTTDFIQEYMDRFWRNVQFTSEDIPPLAILFVITYSKKENLLNRIAAGRQKKRILKDLAKLKEARPDFILMDELKPVVKKDVRKWFLNHLSPASLNQLKHYLKGDGPWEMADVQEALMAVIANYRTPSQG